MEAFVHMTGYVGGDVELRNGTVAVASFRLACTPRVRRGGEWGDANTTWITVTCFRSVAEHAAASINKGDPVIVVGRLRTSVWQKNGEQFERLTLEATTLGHDLSRGTARFRRVERAVANDEGQDRDESEESPGVSQDADAA